MHAGQEQYPTSGEVGKFIVKAGRSGKEQIRWWEKQAGTSRYNNA